MGLFFAAAALAVAQTNLSTWAFPGPSGRVLMQADALGNRIPDYSAVGYKNGTTAIPDVPVKITLSPVAGDDAATIQSAINAVKALPLDTNGFRGAILLNAGEYQIAGNITIDASGIVLRGVGDDQPHSQHRPTTDHQLPGPVPVDPIRDAQCLRLRAGFTAGDRLSGFAFQQCDGRHRGLGHQPRRAAAVQGIVPGAGAVSRCLALDRKARAIGFSARRISRCPSATGRRWTRAPSVPVFLISRTRR